MHAYPITTSFKNRLSSVLQDKIARIPSSLFFFISTFLLYFRTPLHCAASCNSVHLCKLLVESGAAIFASTISDIETAADKCEEMEEGYIQCSQFLYGKL